MGRRHRDEVGGFFQRACGRCLLLLAALTLLCLGISILVLGAQASDKLSWGETITLDNATYVNVTSENCPAGTIVPATDGKGGGTVTIKGEYDMVEPKDAASFFGSITAAVALTGLVSIARRSDCGLFTYSYLLLLLLAGMAWLAIFCSVAHERAATFVGQYWELYRLATPNLHCAPLADVSAADWRPKNDSPEADGAVAVHDMLDTTDEVASAAIVACLLLAFAIFGSVQALASSDEAVVNMVRGSSGMLALFGTALIGAVSWSQARNQPWPEQYAGAWAQSVVGLLGAVLLCAGCCGCCGVRRLSRRCLAINVCSLLAFALACIIVTVLAFSLAKDDTVHFKRAEESVFGPESEAALMRNVNVVAISSAVLTVVVFANLCVSLWLFRNVDVVAARQAEDAEERRLWARASSDRAFGNEGNASDDDDDIEIELGGAIVAGSRPRFDDDDDDDEGFV